MKRIQHHKQERVKIIAGELGGRWVSFYAIDDLRPTGSRIRETLFNWLQFDIVGKTCIDLFAGSGILGVEALSRGAKHVAFAENNPQQAKQLNATLEQLKLPQSRVVCGNYRQLLSEDAEIWFLDPPYHLRLLPTLLEALGEKSPEFIFIEDNQPFETWVIDSGRYHIHKSKKAGNIYYGLLTPIKA